MSTLYAVISYRYCYYYPHYTVIRYTRLISKV